MSEWLKQICVLFVLFALVQGKPFFRETKEKRVSIGDNVTQIEDAPFMVMILIRSTNKFVCAGSLITKQHVLTAAHCILNSIHPSFNYKDIKVRLGEVDKNSTDDTNHIDIQAEYKISHEKFNNTPEHDIAIIKLHHPVELSAKINVICLPKTNETFDNVIANLYGWGEQYIEPSFTNLLKLSLRVIPNAECRKHLTDLNDTTTQILEDQICAGENHRHGCKGDSGSPLIIDEVDSGRPFVIGVLSSGKACGQDFPNIYARITSYKEWILDKIGEPEPEICDYDYGL